MACCSGGYHLRSDACHHPGPCGRSLMAPSIQPGGFVMIADPTPCCTLPRAPWRILDEFGAVFSEICSRCRHHGPAAVSSTGRPLSAFPRLEILLIDPLLPRAIRQLSERPVDRWAASGHSIYVGRAARRPAPAACQPNLVRAQGLRLQILTIRESVDLACTVRC